MSTPNDPEDVSKALKALLAQLHAAGTPNPEAQEMEAEPAIVEITLRLSASGLMVKLEGFVDPSMRHMVLLGMLSEAMHQLHTQKEGI